MSIQPSFVGLRYTVTTPSAPTLSKDAPARAQFVGLTAKGPLNYSGVISTVEEFEYIFGGRVPFGTLYDTVRTYIGEQGGTGECYITRVVGPNATNGSVTIPSGGETPVDTITVEVTDPGEHTTSYSAAVTADTNGTTVAVVDNTSGRTIGTFGPAATVAELIESNLGHKDVTLRSLGPDALPAPGVFPLSGGSDDRAGIVSQAYVDALDKHKAVPAGVAVAIPGQPATVELVTSVNAHCKPRLKEFWTAPRQGATLDEANALGDLIASPALENSALVHPHIRIPDTETNPKKTRVVSPEGYVLAQRSITHRTKSPAAAAAGYPRKFTWAIAPLDILDETDINTLNRHHVNGIVTEGGRHYLYNYLSLSTDAALFELNATSATNALTVNIDGRLRSDAILFEPNGAPELLSRIEGHVAAAMAPYVERGYLQPKFDIDGGVLDPGYVVRVENVNFSDQDAPYDRLRLDVDVRWRPTLRGIDMVVRRLEFRYDMTAAAVA